jgi:hypothetical protein
MQNLEWLESECDGFLVGHSQFGDSCDQATKLKDEHDRFVERIEPTCDKTEKVVQSLEKLRPQAPPLASSIDQLCQAVSERIKGRKALIRRRSSVLDMFVEFCSLYQQVSTSILPYSLKFSRVKYFALWPNSAQKQYGIHVLIFMLGHNIPA